VNAHGVICIGVANCSRLAPSCGSLLPVLNPVVVIPGLRAGTCTVLHGSLLMVSVSTLAAHSSVNNVQAEHHCLQVYSWGSSILSDEFMCSCRY